MYMYHVTVGAIAKPQRTPYTYQYSTDAWARVRRSACSSLASLVVLYNQQRQPSGTYTRTVGRQPRARAPRPPRARRAGLRDAAKSYGG